MHKALILRSSLLRPSVLSMDRRWHWRSIGRWRSMAWTSKRSSFPRKPHDRPTSILTVSFASDDWCRCQIDCAHWCSMSSSLGLMTWNPTMLSEWLSGPCSRYICRHFIMMRSTLSGTTILISSLASHCTLPWFETSVWPLLDNFAGLVGHSVTWTNGRLSGWRFPP